MKRFGAEADGETLLVVDEALTRLMQESPEQAELVKLSGRVTFLLSDLDPATGATRSRVIVAKQDPSRFAPSPSLTRRSRSAQQH